MEQWKMGSIMKKKKETRGGKRPLSGRKKSDYETFCVYAKYAKR